MKNNNQTEFLVQQMIKQLLNKAGVETVSDAEKVLNKLVAVATQSVETLIDHDTSISMLNGVIGASEAKHKFAAVGFERGQEHVFRTPSYIQ